MDAKGLLLKLSGLGQSVEWTHEAILALGSSDDLVKQAVFNATDAHAIALLNLLLTRAGASRRKRVQELPTPSALAKVSEWQRVQEENTPPYFFCFRPGSNDLAALPVALLDPALDRLVGAFAQAVAGQGALLAQEDCALAHQMCQAMAQGCTDERVRETRFTDLLTAYVKVPIHKHQPDPLSAAQTGGTILSSLRCGNSLLCLPVYIQEVKAEIGCSDPYFQGQRRYQLYLTDEHLGPAIRRSVLPVLFTELVGPHMRVSALASGEGATVVCEPLTPFLHLLGMLRSQPQHMDRLARVFRALKEGVQLLQQACTDLAVTLAAATGPDARGRDPSLRLPYLLRPGSGFDNVQLMTKSNSQLLYAGDREGQRVVVKFAFITQQAADVHRAWAEAGLAPALFEVRPLACGLAMLTMELLSSHGGWAMFFDLADEVKRRLCPAVREKLARAHDTIFVRGKKTVHADMRQANVMVKLRENGELLEVRFLDFDWSGLVGEALLPSFMRERVEGFGAGRPATQEYDLALWDHEMRSELNPDKQS